MCTDATYGDDRHSFVNVSKIFHTSIRRLRSLNKTGLKEKNFLFFILQQLLIYIYHFLVK